MSPNPITSWNAGRLGRVLLLVLSVALLPAFPVASGQVDVKEIVESLENRSGMLQNISMRFNPWRYFQTGHGETIRSEEMGEIRETLLIIQPMAEKQGQDAETLAKLNEILQRENEEMRCKSSEMQRKIDAFEADQRKEPNPQTSFSQAGHWMWNTGVHNSWGKSL